MLGTHGHLAVRVLKRATSTETWDILFKSTLPRTRDTHTYCQAFSSEAVAICVYDLGRSRLGFEHPTYRLQGRRSSPLRHNRDGRI